ncbi:MAG: tetraacyldisaccharide 4'-kinase, partial [Bacteroidetes bacterium]|nr:tetraacyldisaccharide 4'-kinase [Bacteroidota bacterium]
TYVLILDDGFQHLQVNRDIDLVLFSAPTLTENMNVFPGGVLREPFSALSRASAIVITGVSDTYQYDIEEFTQRVRRNFPQKPIFLNGYEPQYAKKKGDLTPLPLSQLPPKLFGFCGIASPHRFQNSLQTASIEVLGWKFFRDHSDYSAKLIKSIENNATNIGCTALITTEKDMVKLHSLPSDMPIYSVKMGVTADENFSSYLNNELSAYTKLPK